MKLKNKEPNHISQLVGDCLQQYRKEKNWSGKKMANIIGISQQQLSRYERGITAITVDMLMNIIIIIDVQLSEFYTRLLSKLFNHQDLSSHLPYLAANNYQLEDVKQFYASSVII